MHQHTVAVQCVHRVALGHHDGVTVIIGGIYTVLAVAATDEEALGHHRAVSCLVTTGTHLNQEAVNGQLLQNLDNNGAALGRVGPHSSRDLLVIESSLTLLVKEVNDPVVVLTTILSQRL